MVLLVPGMDFKKFGKLFVCFVLIGRGLLVGVFLPSVGLAAPSLQIVENEIESNSEDIAVYADNISLLKLVEEVEKRSDISFFISQDLEQDTLSFQVTGADWTTVILTALKDYNQIHVWAGVSKLKKVYLVGLQEEFRTSGLNEEVNIPNVVVKKYWAVSNSEGTHLSEKQLRMLAGGKHRSPISSEMFDDPEVRKFLSENGMKKLEDRTNLGLSMKVRIKARKALSSLRRKN